ncbi:uncharacterized protein [Atheta coriaria]
MQMTAEAEIKSVMINVDDYANLNQYVLEASRRREKLYNNKIQVRADGILLNDIKEEEQLAAIATIDPTASTSSQDADPFLIPLTTTPNTIDTVNAMGLHVLQHTSEMADENLASTSAQSEPEFKVPYGKMCHICFRQYPNRTCLLSHVRAVHQTQGKTRVIKRSVLNRKLHLLSPDEMCAIHSEVAKKCEQTQCYECRITLKCAHELQYHITAIHKGYTVNNINFNVKCNICSATFGHKYLKLHLKGHELQVGVENIFCEEVKGQGDNGEENELLHYWQCQACKVMFKSDEQSMEEHLKMHQTLEK